MEKAYGYKPFCDELCHIACSCNFIAVRQVDAKFKGNVDILHKASKIFCAVPSPLALNF